MVIKKINKLKNKIIHQYNYLKLNHNYLPNKLNPPILIFGVF